MREQVMVRDYLVIGLNDRMQMCEVVVRGARNATDAAIRSGLDALDEIELGNPGWDEWQDPLSLLTDSLLTDDIPF